MKNSSVQKYISEKSRSVILDTCDFKMSEQNGKIGGNYASVQDVVSSLCATNQTKQAQETRKKEGKKKLFKCNQCQDIFPFQCRLKIHLITHKKKNLNKCDQCDFESPDKIYLVKHMVTHGFKCKECDYVPTRYANLRAHMMTHTGERPHKCNQCEYTSSTAYQLKQHLMTLKALQVQPVQVCI